MLSIIHKNAYQDFLKLLSHCKIAVSTPSFDSKSVINQKNWDNLEAIFRQQILVITDAEMDMATASSWIAIQAEIQREFRLLTTDWLFLKSARQQATVEARKKTLIQRLDKLINYCRKMIEFAE